MKPLTVLQARSLIKQLNRIDLDRANYDFIRGEIDRLSIGVPIRGITPHKDARLYRGVIYTDKPVNVGQMRYPPADLVSNFQRCNPPNQPMFYCSPDPAAIYYELNVKAGNKIYISKWSVTNDFLILQIAPNVEDSAETHLADIVLTFFETKFSQPIHETYSSQYMITSAIAEKLSKGTIVDRHGIEIGGMSYPSVSHPARSENLAIRPAIVDTCLRLDYVEEILVNEVEGKTIKYTRTDFASTFSDGKIEWQGRILHWTVPPHSQITVTAEQDGWVARDENGNIVNPG